MPGASIHSSRVMGNRSDLALWAIGPISRTITMGVKMEIELAAASRV